AVDHGHLLVQEGEELLITAQSLAEDVEGRLSGEVVDPVDGARGLLRADQDGDLRVREVEEEALEDHLAEEAGHAGPEDPLAREAVDDRSGRGLGGLGPLHLLYHAADYGLSTAR